MRNHAMLATVVISAWTLLLGSCGASGGAGGGGAFQVVGGSVDAPCDPAYYHEGCTPDSKVRVTCQADAADAMQGKWTKIADCIDQKEYCDASKKDPGDSTGVKMLSECKAVQTPSSSGGASSSGASSGGASSSGASSSGASSSGASSSGASSGGASSSGASSSGASSSGASSSGASSSGASSSGTSSSGGGSSSSSSGGGGKTPAETLACAEQKCPTRWATCQADAMCKAMVECAAKCKTADSSCLSACGGDAGPKTLQAALALQGCAQQAGCVPEPTAGPTCGDGKCEGNETSSCPKDCKSGPTCGDGKCEGNETSSCPKDCGGTSTGKCGDLVCKAPESQTTCALDCLPQAKALGECAKSKCALQWSACDGVNGCLDALNCLMTCQEQTCAQACAAKAPGATSQLQDLATCVSSKCLNSGGCQTSSDCASGQQCVNGACTAGGTTDPNSCKDRCGKYDPKAKCHCDKQCSDPQYNDCCPDLKTVCPAAP